VTVNWVQTNFESLADGSVIVMRDGDDFTTCDPNWLSQNTTAISDPPTYDKLSSLPMALQGWQKIFDQWKEKGIVS
jgi:hypothetical protein